MTRPVRVVVLGGGSWGTTVAALAATNTDTLLWARDSEVAEEINTRHRNLRYLEERPLPPSLRATSDLVEARGFPCCRSSRGSRSTRASGPPR